MKVWQVWDGDYDGDWVVATYDSERLAREHADTYGLARIQEAEVLSALTAGASDPVLRAARARKREEAAAASHKEAEDREADNRSRSEWEKNVRIEQQLRPTLCHCRVFTDSEWREMPSGLCRYCYGWTPEVFRMARGEDELERAINDLNLHYRTEMRRICGLPLTEDAVSPLVKGSE